MKQLTGIKADKNNPIPVEIMNIIDGVLSSEVIKSYKDMDLVTWAKKFVEWRAKNLPNLLKLFYLKPELAKLNDSPWDTLNVVGFGVTKAERSGVLYPMHRPENHMMLLPNKNGVMANNLYMFYPRSVNYDAHVRAYPGQNVWRATWASWVGRNAHIATVNPMMKIWAATWAFPVTKLYAISQEVWSSDVQRARRGA